MSCFRITAAALLLLAAPPAHGGAVDLEQIARELNMEVEEIVEPFDISPEMKAWAAARVPRSAPAETRLKLLLESLRGSEDIEFTYHAGHTGTAREVFSTGRFNCLSFSVLFVSLARSLGLEAYFLHVGQVEEYEKQGDLVVLTRHVTAGHGLLKDRIILELDVGPEVNYHLAEPIDDYEALSLYYSNRGTEKLREGDLGGASRNLQLAVRLDPERAQNWVNLGVVERHLGRSDEAERAYLQALEVEPGHAPAYENLAALLRLRGVRRDGHQHPDRTLGQDLAADAGRPLPGWPVSAARAVRRGRR
jgi:tetratricopeptide (TPR) repeat protein